ncbi:MAG: co-chaperone GroES [Planctomycetes bacterium]|jgi:chaperonin GroES|nr:co-chaperone GroES [Planctomycetota bacterium]
MKIVPLNDRVVVRPQEAEARTAGGIVLPEASREKSQQGKVLAVGDGTRIDGTDRRTEPQVSEGDRVLYTPYSGSTVVVNGESLLILSERDILAVLD